MQIRIAIFGCIAVVAAALISAAPAPARAAAPTPGIECVGDCGGDGMVSAADIDIAVHMLFDSSLYDICPAFDLPLPIHVAEVLQAIKSRTANCGVPGQPVLTMSVNQSGSPQAHPGWPVLLELGIEGPVRLASAGPLWIDGLRFEVVGSDGALVEWPWELLRTPDDGPRLDLAGADTATVYAWITPEASRALAPGDFSLRAVFDSTGAPPGAWQGHATSAAVRLSLRPAGEVLPEVEPGESVTELATEKLLRAALFTLQGDVQAARAEVEALVAAEPTHAAALGFLGDLQENAGEIDLAIATYARALRAAIPATSGAEEPPDLLAARHAELRARRMRVNAGIDALGRAAPHGDRRQRLAIQTDRDGRGARPAGRPHRSAPEVDGGAMSARHVLPPAGSGSMAASATRAQPARSCAPLASVEEWNGFVDFSWSVDAASGEGTIKALHQASVGVRLTGNVFAGRGAFHGQPTGVVVVEETAVEFGVPNDSVTTIVGSGQDQSTPQQGGIILEVDLETCEYKFYWGVDLAMATITTDGDAIVAPLNVGVLQSRTRMLGEGEISQSANFDAYSVLQIAQIPPDVDNYVALTPGGVAALWGAVGPAAVSWQFVPGPIKEVELVVSATPNDWLPEAGDDELTPGNFLLVEAYLRNRDGSRPPALRARQMTFRIARSSHEPGIALNAPQADPKSTADLQFDPQLNASLPTAMEVSGEEKETAQIRGQAGGARTLYEEASAYVSAFDYGAFGEVTVSAELEDGRSVQGLVGGVEGETTLLVPRRSGAFVADEWKRQSAVSFPDNDDGETDPSAHPDIAGDGFALYEEYRGVMVGDPAQHVRLNPKKRDFFVLDPTRNGLIRAGILDFRDATGLEVRARVTEEQLGGASNKVVNFNYSGRVPHLVDQEASRIAYVPNSPIAHSEVKKAAGAAGFTTPHDIELVIVRGWTPPSHYLNARAVRVNVPNPSGDYLLRRTVMHELLHSVNVSHHGESDPGWVEWTEMDGKIYERGVEISVILENGVPLTAAQLGLPMDVWVGTPDEQHSGHETCATRYNVATAKVSRAGGAERIWTGREAFGTDLCASAEGTGVNDPLRLLNSGLEPRFDNASKGDCAHQIVVNDSAP